MASSSCPALVGVACAATLALEGTALVLWARDQHAARRCVSRAVVLSSFALALTLVSLLAGSRALFARNGTLVRGDGLLIGSALLVATWALAAATLVELRSGILLLAGGPFPLNLRPALADSVAASPRWPPIGRVTDGLMPRFVCLAGLAVAVGVFASGSVPLVGAVPAVAGDARVAAFVVVATDVAVAALVCVQSTSHTHRARSFLALGIALSCVALASLIIRG